MSQKPGPFHLTYIKHFIGHASRCNQQAVTVGYARLQAEACHGVDSLLDRYGAKDPAEFFAVVSEVFFEQPQALAEDYPALYQELRGYYKLDPVSW